MVIPPIRFEALDWTRATEEHEILGIPRPSAGEKEGLLICVPKEGQGQRHFRKPTESEMASTAAQCATCTSGGNVHIQVTALFGILKQEEQALPTQVVTHEVPMDGDVSRSPLFDQWNPANAGSHWYSASYKGHGFNKADAKSCINAFTYGNELHGWNAMYANTPTLTWPSQQCRIWLRQWESLESRKPFAELPY